MRPPDDSQFDDPALRAALKRVCGRERAPGSLRGRVLTAFATAVPELELESVEAGSAANASLREHWERWHSIVYSGIAAAVMLAGVWLLFQAATGGLEPRPEYAAYPARPAREVPVFLAGAMVGTHANCAKLPDHHSLPDHDLVAIRRKLQSQLGFPIGAIQPGDGWVFKGASTCKVGHHPAAHLLFVRGTQAVSVFSLPARATYQASSGESYQSELNGCVMSGAVEGSGLYCVVASGLGSATDCPTLHQVNDFRDALLASLSDGSCSPSPDPASAQTPTVTPISH